MTILQSGIAQAAAGATGYQIARSLRFNSADSAYLSRTLGTATNQKKWTWSGWVKRSALPAAGCVLFSSIGGGGGQTYIAYGGSTATGTAENSINLFGAPAQDNIAVASVNIYRDVSAWYHIVVSVDTTQATAANRVKMYVNGVEVSYATSTYPTLNQNLKINSATAHGIGATSVADSWSLFNGYMTEINFIDGQALTPSSFGQTDSATGVWSPIAYTGTYGTNGFWLKFDDNSGTTSTTLGKDSSGNSNNWTPNNFSVTAGVGNDSLVDTPTNYGTDTGVGGEVRGNYATLNPLDNAGNTLADGNLSGSKGGGWTSTRATMACPTTGKWYWEAVITAGGNNMAVGIATSAAALSGDIIGRDANGWGYVSGNGQKWTNGSGASYGSTWTAGDIIGIAFDAGAGTLTFYKNNTSQGTAFSSLTGGPYFPAVSFESTTGYVNFGQRPFAYTAPSGFKALCTQNLPTPAIGATSSTLASKNFNPVLYTGNGSTLSVTGVGFQPDWVWAKVRSTTGIHGLFDVVRGVTKVLSSDSANTENTLSGVTAFNSDGFSLGSDWNLNGGTYVAWNWKAGGTAVTNTSGSISSQVSANPTAGISVVTYTGNGTSGATFGHGLGAVPKMVIFKCRDTAYQWLTYHVVLGNTAFVILDSDSAQTTGRGDFLNSTTPSSSLVTLGNTQGVNESTKTYLAYCFSEVAGFSKFGSYTGNGSSDGPFVYCGFRPKFILVKSSGSASWILYDTSRSTYNVNGISLIPDLDLAELNSTDWYIDVLSNGFKLRTSYGQVNNSGTQFIFMAFAEAPFNYSRAR